MKDIRSLGLLKEHGYIPWNLEPENETVAKALEYCAADDGVAKVAKLLGKVDDYEYFFNRSRSYKKYYDPETRFMRAVGTDGKFRLPFNPFFAEHRTNDYTEGNAWQYTFLVPHDVKGLINLFGSDKAFMSKLDSLFFVEGWAGNNASPDMSGMTGQYAHGNEPSHHVIYMYNYAGRPDKAAPLLRKMLNEMYLDQPDGLSGNEDVGQMSAWYILSSVGLYQVDPVGGRFVIGSPLFDKATVNVGAGKTFTVVAKNNSDRNIYVQSARLNGKALKNSYIEFNDIRHGGTLELVMGPKPSKWGAAPACRP
jgi:predicted alpha-1,2-mannosidase